MTKPMNYREIYKAGEAEGFNIVDAKYNFTETRGLPTEYTSHIIETPYRYDGRIVYGFANVYTKIEGKSQFGEKTRYENTHELEFYVQNESFKDEKPSYVTVDNYCPHAKNLEDICNGNPREVVFTTKDGKEVLASEGYDKMQAFVSAASQYPHACKYDEFVAAQESKVKAVGDRFPDIKSILDNTKDDYDKYIDKVTRELADPDIKYVGRITKPSDVSKMYEWSPNFQEGFEEWNNQFNTEDQFQ